MARPHRLSTGLFAALLTAGCAAPPSGSDGPPASTDATIVLASELAWEQLNPARGDKSPQAATIWGDRKGEVPTGFLAKFVDGFSSPPHIHNATYRAVVLSGLVHNDDPAAAPMWMPPGSFWTQPKGEVHITSSKGESVALVEIDRGPYLVMPPAKAFDSGERPINADPSNLVWVDPPGLTPSASGPKLAYLWGTLAPGQSNGTFVRLPAGSTLSLRSHGLLRAVVILGTPEHLGSEPRALPPGSYLSSEGEAQHRLRAGPSESVLYVRAEGSYEVLAE